MANGEKYVKAEDDIIIKHWDRIPDWRGMMLEFEEKGFKRTLEQVKQRAFRLAQYGKVTNIGQGKRLGVSVRCIETGRVFLTMTDAATYYAGVQRSSSSISNVIRGKAKTAFGYHWEIVRKV